MRHTLIFLAMAAASGFAQVKPAAPAARTTAATSASAKLTTTAPTRDEQAIFDSANRERTMRGLPPLKWNAKLASAARAHAQKMAQAGTLSHEFPGEASMGMRISVTGVHYSSVAENVAQAASAALLHQEWMNSPSHRDNILDPQFDSLGVAIAERNGELFAVQDFARVSE